MSQPPPPDPSPRRLAGKRVTLCVTGSIAAYKAVLLLRLLQKEGAELELVLTRSATEFVGVATFSGLLGKTPHLEMFDAERAGELHVELARRSDVLVIAPATADVMARLAGGRADDLTSALVLCARCPIVIAPAMHPNMWENLATRRNVELLQQDGRVRFAGPLRGEVASGEVGVGRMAEPEQVLGAIAGALAPATLLRRHIVVTAGPTTEDLDPVRTLTNRSSGKMGFAIAERAAQLGARVTLIAGPVTLPTPLGVTRVDVRSALAMRTALWQALHPDLSAADALIMCAAVADYRPAQAHAAKLKRTDASLKLELVPNPDLVREIGEARSDVRPVLVGFALETDTGAKLLERAREKLSRKHLDFIVANNAEDSIGRDAIRAVLVGSKDSEELSQMPKFQAADRILAWVAARLRETGR